MQWIRANGGEWTYDAADNAAGNGHLETLKWIRANGGKWTTWSANLAAINGHLETLKWIHANGEWTLNAAANWAAENGTLLSIYRSFLFFKLKTYIFIFLGYLRPCAVVIPPVHFKSNSDTFRQMFLECIDVHAIGFAVIRSAFEAHGVHAILRV